MRHVLTTGFGIVLFLSAAATVEAQPDQALWQAIAQVESGGNVRAYNPRDGAGGIVQIRPVCVSDVNRIARRRGLDDRFRVADRYNPALARRMWILYLNYYGDLYRKHTGRSPTREVYARIWNGGPSGWRKTSTRGYWRRVQAALQQAT